MIVLFEFVRFERRFASPLFERIQLKELFANFQCGEGDVIVLTTHKPKFFHLVEIACVL